MFQYTQKENVDNLLRLRSIWYRQTPNVLKRVMPTPTGVNSYFSSCTLFLKFGDFDRTRI